MQVGAFRDSGNAERLRDRLSVSYTPIVIQQYDVADGTFYRVRVGKISGESAAQEFAEQLRAKEGFSPMVLRLDEVPAPEGTDGRELPVLQDWREERFRAKLVWTKATFFAFEDISPQAPTHILMCPRKHFASLHEANPEDRRCWANCRWWLQDCEGTRAVGGLSHGVQ